MKTELLHLIHRHHAKTAASIGGVVLMGIVLALMVLSLLADMRLRADRMDDERSINTVTLALNASKAQLTATLRDNAVWDDAYVALNSENPKTWVHKYWGSMSADYPLYDGVVVLAADGRNIVSYIRGEEVDPTKEFSQELFENAIEMSRNPSTSPQVGIQHLRGELVMVSTMVVQPFSGRSIESAPTKSQTLTFFKILNPAWLETLSRTFQLGALSLDSSRQPDMLSVPVADPKSGTLAWLSWPSLKPGTTVFNEIIPELYIIAGLFFLHGTSMVFIGAAQIKKLMLASAEAEHEATHDQLTGLLNRKGLQRHFERVQNEALVLQIIDIDGMKYVNDHWGHAYGDLLLQAIAERLKALEPDWTAATRLGGDEFAVIQSANTSNLTPEAVLHRLVKPIEIQGVMVDVGASIGVAEKSPHLSAMEAVRRADVALYRAKDLGRRQVVCYDPTFDLERKEKDLAGERLSHAIQHDMIGVAFQPIVSACSGTLIGYEALARWTSSDGVISPELFIPLAEQTGSIRCLSQKIFADAIAAVSHLDGIELSVNASPLYLCSPSFVTDVEAILREEAFDPQCLVIEVTETALISKPDQARRAMEALHRLGVRFAMDDFGAGYASIGTLRSFPFDRVKIDRSLVQNANDDVLEATVRLAASLGMRVTAEGVETLEQSLAATKAGCHLLQGYYWGRPTAIDCIENTLRGPKHSTG